MNELNTKKTYQPPLLERVSIDNEMSLILVSPDPGDPSSYDQDNYDLETNYYYYQQPQ